MHGVRAEAWVKAAAEALVDVNAYVGRGDAHDPTLLPRLARRCASLAVLGAVAPPPPDAWCPLRAAVVWLVEGLARDVLAPDDFSCMREAFGTPAHPKHTLRLAAFRPHRAYVDAASRAFAHEHTFAGIPWRAVDVRAHAPLDADARASFARRLSTAHHIVRVAVCGRFRVDVAITAECRALVYPMHRVLGAPLPPATPRLTIAASQSHQTR